MMSRTLIAVLPYLAFASVAPASMSDVICEETNQMTIKLEQRHGAERQGMGFRDPDTLLEVWVTPQNGEWFILQNYANGTSCIVAMGQHWEASTSGPA